MISLAILSGSITVTAQEFTLKAVEADTGKPLTGIPITMRYGGTVTGTGANIKLHDKYIQRRTGRDGIAHFPEAGSLKDIDDVYSLPIAYGMVCCDVQPKTFPSTATMTFRKRTLRESLHWIFVGD